MLLKKLESEHTHIARYRTLHAQRTAGLTGDRLRRSCAMRPGLGAAGGLGVAGAAVGAPVTDGAPT